MYVMLTGLFSVGVRPHTWRVSAYKQGCYEVACEPELLQQAWEDTVRHRGGLRRLPLPISIGAGFSVNDLTTDELALAAAQLRARGDDRG